MIRVEHLSKSYASSFSKTDALRDISFAVGCGEILGILGPNGAGKSTLIKILATILNRDTGQIYMADCTTDDAIAYRQKFTVALQNSSLELWLSVEDNLKIYGKFFGLQGTHLSKQIDEVIGLFGLKEFRRKRASELSGGYRKRLQLARSFLVDTPVMMLDEPTAGLDPLAKNQVIRLLKDRAAQGKSIIFTTQVIAEAEALCNRVLILNQGRKIAEGNVEDIKALFSAGQRMEFKFEEVTESIVREASSICQLTGKAAPEQQGSSLLFDLTVVDEADRQTMSKLLESLCPISVSTKDLSLEEIFIELLKEGVV